MTNKIKTVALVSGGMDPMHPGHVRMFKDAKKSADILIVALNSDKWLERKKGRAFMPYDYREELISEMKCVDKVIEFNDDDNTANDALKQARELYPDAKILFCNGGDRSEGNVPEEAVAKEHNIELVYGVGGDYKLTASSELLRKYTYPTEQRPWGEFTVLFDGPEYKLKELLVHPGSALSLQYHYHRRELWLVIEGTGRIILDGVNTIITAGQHIIIEVGQTHKLINPGKLPLRIVEIQQGDYLEEDDIVRLDLDTLGKCQSYKGK